MEKEALYLFFVDNVKGRDASGDYAGYMPLGYQSGFIYGNPGAQAVAHELAHGAFNLYHTFSNEKFVASQNTTDNLMDYKGGTELWKYQWQLIHNPQNVWLKFLQDEEEGEKLITRFSSKANEDLFNKMNNELMKIGLYKAVYNYIEKETGITYAFVEDAPSIGPRTYKERTGAATSLEYNSGDVGVLLDENFNFKCVSFAITDEDKKEIVYVEKLPPEDFSMFKSHRGYILLKMDKLNKETLFHELNHAAQYILYKNNGYAFNDATFEVETRMIVFYAAFKAAPQTTRENRKAMKTFFLNYYGLSNLGTFAPFLGEEVGFRDSQSMSFDYYYNFCRLYFSSKIDGIDAEHIVYTEFKRMMEDLATNLNKEYEFKKDFVPNYYLIDKLTNK